MFLSGSNAPESLSSAASEKMRETARRKRSLFFRQAQQASQCAEARIKNLIVQVIYIAFTFIKNALECTAAVT
jgi:hypothetical protein